MTPLDAAHAGIADAADPDVAWARFHALLVETQLHAPVAEGPADAPVRPLVFELETGPAALAFDDDARMAAFFDAPTEHVTLPGGALIALLAEAGLSLGLNFGDAPSATLLQAGTVAWIAREAAAEAVEADLLDGPLAVGPPDGAPPALLEALATRLAAMTGLVAEAWLVRLSRDGGPGRLSLLVATPPAAARAAEGLAAALGRTAALHAVSGDPVAVGPVHEDHPAVAAARARGFGLHPGPRPEAPAASRPDRPPRLR